MREHKQLIYRAFDTYASLGTSEDLFHMSANGFAQFCADSELVSKGHKSCSPSHAATLFYIVNAKSPDERSTARAKQNETARAANAPRRKRSMDVAPTPEDDNRHALCRHEWMQCLVRPWPPCYRHMTAA